MNTKNLKIKNTNTKKKEKTQSNHYLCRQNVQRFLINEIFNYNKTTGRAFN